MALQSSGQITLSEIWSEYNSGATPATDQNISLGTLSVNTADGGGDPDAMSEFYGLSAAPAFVATDNFAISTYTGDGGTQSITSAIAGQSAVLNGSSSYVDLPNSLTTGLTSAGSISLWVNCDNSNNDGHSPISLMDTIWINVWINSTNTVYARLVNSSVTVSAVESTDTVINNGWNHVVFKWSNTANQVELYLNNVSQGTASWNGTNYDRNNDNVLGQYGQIGVGRYYEGKLSNVRIYSKALSDSEVTTLYNETYSSTISISNLHAHYKLDGSVTDEVGSYNGTAYSITYKNDTPLPKGRLGQAAHFDGSYNRIDISSLKSFFAQKATSSVSYWFKAHSVGSGNDHLFNDYNGTGSPANFNQYQFIDTSGYLKVYTRYNNNGASSTLIYTGSTNLRDNNWHHLVVVVNQSSNTRQVYLDKILLDNSTLPTGSYVNSPTASWFVSIGDLYVGTGTGGNAHDGLIDDVRIYNDALTSTEVEYIYNNDTSNIPTSNLEAHYKLDGNANDETGSHNGTVYGAGFAGSNFQPDLVWIKNRDETTNHSVYDILRGPTYFINPNTNTAEDSASTLLTSFDPTGFTVGSHPSNNKSGIDYVAWVWKAGGAGVSNTSGSITSTVSANQAAGFSIIKYIGNATSGATIGHGLSAAPELVIVKDLNPPTTRSWGVYHKDVGNQYYLLLDSNAVPVSNSTVWNNTSPSSSVITLGSASLTNDNGRNLIAYAFHSVSGYSKIGSYSGNGSNTNKITTGFKPRFLLVKQTTLSTRNWYIIDSARNPSDPRNKLLMPNLSDAEYSGSGDVYCDFLSDGFEWTSGAGAAVNQSGADYIYLAIA